MDVFSLLKLFGGLGLFLYGMTVMGNGLERFAGGKLEKWLESFSSTPIKGVFLGAVVTALIQSSSATTVMVVGFVNAGIMRLTQAIGIIMGANVGTTVTAWILSLTGLSSSNPMIMFLQPKNFSLVFAIIGAILYLFSKSDKKVNVGQILLGFTILIYGMDFMSSAMSPLRSNPEFANLLVLFSNPIAGVLLGMAVTAIIQSSSASVGILQALATTVNISFSSAVPIILGQNVGTCVTAMLSCIGASKNAKRVAFVHLYFNIIGTIIFLILTYALKAFIGFAFWENPVSSVEIAIIHTIFNVSCTILFLPFTKWFERLACLTVKDEPLDKLQATTQDTLDQRFLLSPSYAISRSQATAMEMAGLAKDNVNLALSAIFGYSAKDAEVLQSREHSIDVLEDKLNNYLILLTKQPLSLPESRYVSKLLHAINDFERIADHAENIMEIAGEMDKNNITFSTVALEELKCLTSATTDILEMAVKVYQDEDITHAADIDPLEEVIDLLCGALRNNHIERVKSGSCSTVAGMMFGDLLINLERIADHCSNLAVQVIELKDDSYRSHALAHKISESPDNDFIQKFNVYKKKYASIFDIGN